MRYESPTKGSFALVGFSITEEVMNSYRKRFNTNQDLVVHLQTLLHIPISFAIIADRSKEISNMICCWANWTDSYYDCSEMMMISVAEVFVTMIPKLVEVRGGLRRVFVREAELIRCDFPEMETTPPRSNFEHQQISRLALNGDLDSNIPEDFQTNTGQLMAPIHQRSPFQHLAPELFLEIIEYTLSEISAASPSPVHDRQRCAVTLSHIDSRLRAITLSSPKLWTYISITHRRSSWKLAMLCYARTGQCCLQVEIALRRSPTNFQQISGPLITASSRIKSLSVSPTLETQPELGAFLYELNAPKLEDLTLLSSIGAKAWTLKQLPLAPNLAKLTINRVQVAWAPWQHPNLVTLQWNGGHKGWCNPHVSLEHLVGNLNDMQRLQSLVLKDLVFTSFNDFPSVMYLPALLDLSLLVDGSMFRLNLLSSIDAPNLERLHLDCGGFHHLRSASLLRASPKRLDKVQTLKLQNIQPGTAEWIIHLCPNATHLVLDDFTFLELWSSTVNCEPVMNGGERPQPGLMGLLRLDVVWNNYFWDADAEMKLGQFLSARQKLGYPALSRLFLNVKGIGSNVRPSANDFKRMVQRLTQWVDEVECVI